MDSPGGVDAGYMAIKCSNFHGMYMDIPEFYNSNETYIYYIYTYSTQHILYIYYMRVTNLLLHAMRRDASWSTWWLLMYFQEKNAEFLAI